MAAPTEAAQEAGTTGRPEAAGRASFPLVTDAADSTDADLELVLADGRRLRIHRGADGGHLAGGAGRPGAAGVLSFPAAIKVYLCRVACDMRRSFDGLAMMAEHIIGCNHFSGHLLVFCNRRSDGVMILYSCNRTRFLEQFSELSAYSSLKGKQSLTSLPRGLKVQSLEQPVLVVLLAEFASGLGRLLQGLEVSHPEELLFDGAEEPFYAAIALGFTDEDG